MLQTSEMGTEGEAPTSDIGQNRDEATISSVNLILEGMRRMQEELLSVRQEEVAERSERKAQKENYTFKRKGNELQHKFNDRATHKVAAAADGKGGNNLHKFQGASSIALRRSLRKVRLSFYTGKK